ncbi:MAG: esterase [Proteobacteria bacterium]|nr:esterase [Pseudomonadota bacterium]
MVNRREFAGAALVAAMTASTSVTAAETASAKGATRRIALRSPLLPAEVNVTIYTPAGHRSSPASPLPLMLLLHGGNGSDLDLLRFIPAIDTAIAEGRLPPMVIATPSAGRSLYMDFHDGSQRWESFILSDLLAHLRKELPVSKERRSTFIGGFSMGGLGSLRIAFKHPEVFGAVAAVEPAIEPALSWSKVGPRVKFWRPDAVIQPMFGAPVDLDYWAANNPATIAKRDPARLFDLPIYLEVGDQDMLYLTQGVEFLHRILFDAGLGHEYRIVHGADHVGPSLAPRVIDALAFIGRQIQPPNWIDRSVLAARAGFSANKSAVGLPDEAVDPRRIHGQY